MLENDIDEQYLNIKDETVGHMKDLLNDVKTYKHQQLENKIKELEKELKEIKKAKKYGLVWEEKQEFFDKETIGKLPVLLESKEKSINHNESENNIIIEGDNYHSLSVLNYTHKGKIDVIYIDPPYNTGNNDFIYNDKIVDKEDKFRHSKWLSFMNKRLKIAKNLLSDSGVIFISIDDNEQAQLKLLCDEIFGNENFIAQIIWQKKYRPQNDAVYFSENHDYILCIAKNRKKNKDDIGWERNLLQRSENALLAYNNPDNDPRGVWQSSGLMIEGETKNGIYEINGPTGKKFNPLPGKRWSISKTNFDILIKENRIWFGKDGNASPRIKRYLTEVKNGIVPSTIFLYEDSGHTGEGKKDLIDIFDADIFSYPKPIKLIKKLLLIAGKQNSTILDFFAGSGTTGHSVLELNKEDGGNRKFILCSNRENTKEELEKNICEKVTYERVKRVMTGYTNSKGEQVEGLGGNLTYLKTDFIDKSNVNDDLRVRMVKRCTELLCLKENIWNEIKQNNNKIKIFERHDKYLAILYDMFFFDDFKEVLKTLNKSISIYAFSHYKLNKRDFVNIDIDFEIEQIPDPILEVYESIFGL